MKSLFIICAFTVPCSVTSCIYEAPDDKFYRTLWKSEEVPLGPFDISTITLEFLYNGEAVVTLGKKTEAMPAGDEDSTSMDKERIVGYIYGKYSPDDRTAVLEKLTIKLQDTEVTFIEAHHNGDILFLLWRVENSLYPFTTALHRLSSYD